MRNGPTQRWQRERGSALLLTLLLTIAGAALLGLAVDATSLVWVRSNAQTTANLVAASIALELERYPTAPVPYLEETARAAAGINGFRHGQDSSAVHLERVDGKTAILLERHASVYFLRMMRQDPIAVRARATVESSAIKAGL